MQYKPEEEINEYDFLKVIKLYNKKNTYEEISQITKLKKDLIFKILVFSSKFPLLPFQNYENDFKYTQYLLDALLHFDFNSLHHTEFVPGLIVGHHGHGKTSLLTKLLNSAEKYYKTEYKDLEVQKLVTDDLNYFMENIEDKDIICGAVDDATKKHDYRERFSSELKTAIQDYWDMRKIPKNRYGREKAVIILFIITHIFKILEKSLRTTVRFMIFKNTFPNEDENKILKREIGPEFFEFLERITNWRKIHPLFSKFFVLKLGDLCFYGKFEEPKEKITMVKAEKTIPKGTDEKKILQAFILKYLGAVAIIEKYLGRKRIPPSYTKIQKILKDNRPASTFRNTIDNEINFIKEHYDLSFLKQGKEEEGEKEEKNKGENTNHILNQVKNEVKT